MADKHIGHALLTKTYTAGEDLIGNRLVKGVTGGNTVVYADAGELAIGVVRDTVSSGKLADVVEIGDWPIEASENIARNLQVAAAADGKLAPATTTNNVVGISKSDANTGEFCMTLLAPGGIY